MGAPISEMARSRQDTRRSWVYFAAVVVGVLAAVLRLLGVDNVEVFATLLFAAVFGATVLAGGVTGYLTAGLATALYAWMRRDALDDVGVTLFAVVVASRAVSYLVLAGVSHMISDRLPGVPLPGVMGRPWGSPGGEARLRASATTRGEALHMSAKALWDGDQQAASSDDVLPASWSAIDDDEAVWGPLSDTEHFEEVEGLTSTGDLSPPTDEWGSTYREPAPPPPLAPSMSEGFQAPADRWPVPSASPELPRGWMSDEPLGDETIPIGLTGELFLPEMTAGPSQPMQRPPERPLTPDPRPLGGELPDIDPGTELHTAHYLRDRLAAEREVCRSNGSSFSMVMVQMPDTPFRALSHSRQVALLRELGYQFGQAGMVDHLIHLPDGARHWFAVVLAGTDKQAARTFERRLRSAIAGYFGNRGLRLEDVESATLTSPDDDEPMAAIWSSLLGQPAGR